MDDFDEVYDDDQVALDRVVFPGLQSLSLDDIRWLQQIDAPSLKKLVITRRYVDCDEMDTEVIRRFDHVRELQLCGEFELLQFAILKDVSNITTLTFDSPSTLTTAFNGREELYQINSAVLRELTGFKPPIWRHLQHINFGAPLYHNLKSRE